MDRSAAATGAKAGIQKTALSSTMDEPTSRREWSDSRAKLFFVALYLINSLFD